MEPTKFHPCTGLVFLPALLIVVYNNNIFAAIMCNIHYSTIAKFGAQLRIVEDMGIIHKKGTLGFVKDDMD